jgi:lipoate-protein ligase B
MAYWEGIIGCGLKDYPVASLAGLMHPAPSLDQVSQAVTQAFGEVFGFEMVAGETSDKRGAAVTPGGNSV